MEDKSVVTQSPSVNTYKSEGKLYEVPKENEQEFLDNVKDAQKVFMFESEGKKYEVPPADVSEFMTNVTDAKPLHNYDFSQNPNASIDQSSESAPQPATQSDKGFWANAGEDFVNASKLAGYHLAKATEYQAAKIGDKMGGLSDNQSWKDYWKSDSDQSKENIQSLDKWGNAIPKLHGGAGGFVASSLPMIGATAAAIMLKNPMAASALTGTMGQMMFGSGIDAYDKHIDEQKDLFSKGQIAKEPTVDEGTKLGTGILYGVLGTLPIAGTIGKWIPKGLFQKSIQTALESNPETINNAGKVIWENFVKDAPGVAKQLLNQAKEGLGSSIANMEVMQLGQKAVDKWMIGQEGIGVKEFGETAVSALGSAILFHGALVPFSMYAQNTATMQRRNSQGRVDLGKDVEGNPVEIVKDGKGGFYGVTPEGKTVKVDPDEAQNIVTIPINVFKQSLQEAKGNGGKLFENADVYAVKGNLENTANQVGYKNTGDILIHFDQDGKRFFVKDGDLKDPKAKLTLVGEDGKTYSGTVPRNQINTLTKEQFINEGLDRYTSTKPTEVTDPILPHIEAKRTEHIDQVDNHIANFQHESGNLIKVKTQKGAERYVIKGDLNDPGDMIFLKDPNNPSEPPTIVTSQGLEIIDQVPSDQYRQSQIADFDAQSADVVDKLNQKKQQKAQEEAHATSLGIGDPVTVPDGRTGKISRVNGRDQVFVALDENEGQEVNPTLYNPSEITKIEPPVEQSTIEPVTDQQNEQQPNPNPTQDVPVHKEQLINIGTASKPQNTRIVTDPDGIKRIDVNFDTDAKAKKVAEIIRTKGKVSANYDVTVDKVEINPDDEFTDVIYTVTLRPKVAVVPKIDEKSSETAGPPTVEVKQGQVPKTSAPVEPVKGENVAENVNITETKNEIVPENKIQESKIEPITDLGNLESSHKLQVLQKVNQESLPKEGAELSPEERKTVHNSLVGLVEKFNDIPNNHTNKRSSVQSQILQTVQRLGEGYKVDVDRQRNITVTKEGKKIGRIGTKQSTEEVNTHPLLSEYPQEVQDFYGRLNASNSIEFLDIPTSINQGVRNIQEGKKSVAANSVLDEVERMFSEGVVKLKGTKNSPAINVPVQEYFATFEKPLSPEEEKFAETLSQDDHEKLWQIASYYDLTPEQTEEVDNLFLEHGKESQIDRTAGVQPEVDAEGAKPEVTGRNQGEDLSQGQITQVQDELKKARAAYSKANNLYNKLKNSPEFGGKGQISQDGTIAGHDAIDFGNDAILNGAKKKADQARLAVTETEKKLAKLEDEKVDKVHNQQDLFKEESSPLTDLIESAKKKSEPIVPLNTHLNM
ncbi:MAG: hypothetical protein M1445_08835, partial [Bacteroidetes bacterium]|nr:hypothetical protein [Bacteroidota bacterium]